MDKKEINISVQDSWVILGITEIEINRCFSVNVLLERV